MAKSNYKYNIKTLVNELTVARAKTVVTELEKEGVSERTFQRDKAILISDATDIPAMRLMIYAKFFEVSIEQLFNYDADVKPINRRKLTIEKKVLKKTGLKPLHR